jgi:hypothetical protein
LQVGQYGIDVCGIHEEGPPVGREEIIQSIWGSIKLHGGKIVQVIKIFRYLLVINARWIRYNFRLN